MENQVKEPVQAQGSRQVTLEMVQDWCRKDLRSALFFLDELLRDDELLDVIAERLFHRAEQYKKDNGLLDGKPKA